MLDPYTLERHYWSKGWQDAASYGPRLARTEWTPLQRMAYDAGYDSVATWKEETPKPHGWRHGAQYPHPTRW